VTAACAERRKYFFGLAETRKGQSALSQNPDNRLQGAGA
jgi:hypothetical protein